VNSDGQNLFELITKPGDDIEYNVEFNQKGIYIFHSHVVSVCAKGDNNVFSTTFV
jgi:hypothetical protein